MTQRAQLSVSTGVTVGAAAKRASASAGTELESTPCGFKSNSADIDKSMYKKLRRCIQHIYGKYQKNCNVMDKFTVIEF
jgi:hypothetical protein